MSYGAFPYFGKLELTITPATLVLPAYMNELHVHLNQNIQNVPIVTSSMLSTSFGPQVVYLPKVIKNGGVLTFSGYILGLATSALNKANLYDVLTAVSGTEVSTITITSSVDGTKSNTYKDCTCTASSIRANSIQGLIVFEGMMQYHFSYMS